MEHEGQASHDAQQHFVALRSAFPKMRGFVLTDPNDSENKTFNFIPNMRGIVWKQWQRYEIENYLIHPDAIERTISKWYTRRELFISDAVERAHQALRDTMPGDYFKDPVNYSGAYLRKVKGSAEILPAVFEATGVHIEKSDYHRIANIMKPEEISADVVSMLDEIARHLDVK